MTAYVLWAKEYYKMSADAIGTETRLPEDRCDEAVCILRGAVTRGPRDDLSGICGDERIV